mgnify:FL=1
MIYAYPTEGVWGLGCLPDSEEDVKKICLLKQRKLDKGLILVSGNFSHFDAYLSHLSEDLINKTKSKWPGAHTCLLYTSDAADE